MNLERITDYGIKTSRQSPKDVQKVSGGASESIRHASQDNFERKDGEPEGNAVSQEIRAFAEAAPDLRDERLAEIREKIATGVYHSDGFIDELAANLALTI